MNTDNPSVYHFIRAGISILILLLFIGIFPVETFAGEGPKKTCKQAPVSFPANPHRLQVLGKGLGFPFKNTKRIAQIRAFGIMPWGSEPFHGGMDIIIKNTGPHFVPGQTIKVVSPADGVVVGVRVFEDPDPDDDDFGFSVTPLIEVNPGLWVALTFEPKIGLAEYEQLQIDSIKVKAGDRVKQGQYIGDLVIGQGEGGQQGSANPHIHYEVILKDPETTIEDILLHDTSFTDVWNLPTSICPYDYSSTRAKKMFEQVFARADGSVSCRCPCKYPYNHETCGVGCID